MAIRQSRGHPIDDEGPAHRLAVSPRRRRVGVLPLALLALLTASSLVSAWFVQGLVRDQERGLLEARAAEADLVLRSLTSNTQARLNLVGTVLQASDGSPETFAYVAAERAPGVVSLAVLRQVPEGFVVELAAGPNAAVGQVVTGPRAEAMARALAVPALVSTPVMAEGGLQLLGFALGPPAAPAGTVVYRESVVAPRVTVAGDCRGTVLGPDRGALRLAPGRPHPAGAHQRRRRRGADRLGHPRTAVRRRRQPVAARRRRRKAPGRPPRQPVAAHHPGDRPSLLARDRRRRERRRPAPRLRPAPGGRTHRRAATLPGVAEGGAGRGGGGVPPQVPVPGQHQP